MSLRLPDLEVPGALLTVGWDSVGVERRITVTADGTAWCWNLAGAGPGSDEIGTYRLPLDHDTRRVVEDLARSVRPAEADPGGRLGVTLTAGAGPEWVPEGSERAGEVAAVTGPLLEQLLAAPLAVARWVIAVRRSPGERRAVFSASGLGTEDVRLLFDAETLQLTTADGFVEQVPPPRMGLVTPDVELLDGLHEPAVLAPGRSGACAITLPGTDSGHQTSVARVGTVTGSIALPGPWSSTDADGPDPMLAFTARAEVHSLG